MLINLADLHSRQRRDRPPYLVGKIGRFHLLMVGHHKPAPGEPDFSLFIGRFPSTTDAKPLPPVGILSGPGGSNPPSRITGFLR
jgi:hypothetical protein